MLVVMERTALPEQVQHVCDIITKLGLTPHPLPGAQRTAIGITGNKDQIDAEQLGNLPGVRDVIHVTQPFKLVSREFHPEDSRVEIGDGISVGGGDNPITVMAGPCSIESRDQAFRVAEAVAAQGTRIYRGGAYKPRTSPYTFQGLGREGLDILAEVREQFGLKIITEAIDTDTLDLVASYTDIVQIGARNMQNFSLLKKVGRLDKPVLLKRGIAATLQELLMSAEYILAEGNRRVILCERGVRTFADHTRNTLDLSAVPYVKRLSHLPIITDPSHGTGRRNKVTPLSRASIAVGADGIIVEVHNQPELALSDGVQALTLDDYETLIADVQKVGSVLGRNLQ